jgi:3-hydroxybutyrate dehydrogenase
MLKGKTALVTGSTSGIGLGIAKGLARQGAHVVLNGFGDAQGPCAEVRAAAAQAGHEVRVEYHGADMSRPADIEEMMAFAARELGRVDILVNNAGIQHVASTEDFPVERWDSILAINLSSAFHTTRLALPAMKAANWGRIINVASVHGLVASAQKAAYVAAKHGVVGLTKVVALETATTGVTCNAICPGWVLHTAGAKASGRQGGGPGYLDRGGHAATAGRKGAVDAVHYTRRTGRTGRVLLLQRRQQRAWCGLEHGWRLDGAVRTCPEIIWCHVGAQSG